MKLKPIKTEHDYHQALERLEQIFDSKPGTKEGDELEILGILIENYENDFFPIDLPDPIEAIKFRMEQLNYSQKRSTIQNRKRHNTHRIHNKQNRHTK